MVFSITENLINSTLAGIEYVGDVMCNDFSDDGFVFAHGDEISIYMDEKLITKKKFDYMIYNGNFHFILDKTLYGIKYDHVFYSDSIYLLKDKTLIKIDEYKHDKNFNHFLGFDGIKTFDELVIVDNLIVSGNKLYYVGKDLEEIFESGLLTVKDGELYDGNKKIFYDPVNDVIMYENKSFLGYVKAFLFNK